LKNEKKMDLIRQVRTENNLTQWAMAICGSRASIDVDNLRDTLPDDNYSSMSCSSFFGPDKKITKNTLTLRAKGIEITRLLMSELVRCGVTIVDNQVIMQQTDCYSKIEFCLHSEHEAEAVICTTFPSLEIEMLWRDWKNFQPFRSSF